MNKIKKIAIIVIISIIVLIGIIVVREKITKEKIANDIKLFLNDEIESEYIKEKKDFVNELKNPTSNELDISLLINDYIENVEKCIRSKANSENVTFDDFKNFNSNIDLYAYFGEYGSYIQELITDDDVENYNSNLFKEYIINELEKKLIHKSKELYNGWYVKNDKNKIIELPYNVYINFVACDIKKLGNNIEILNVKLCEKDKNNKLVRSEVQYMIDDEIKNVEMWYGIEKDKDTKKTIYSIPGFWSIYYSYNDNLQASAKLGQHDYDAYEKKWLEEHDSSQNTTPQREWSDEEVGYHEEWKEVFDGDGKVGLYHYFEDDRWEYRFRMIKYNNDGVIKGFHLPYTEEMTIDEVVERFLNDEEQVKKAKALWE